MAFDWRITPSRNGCTLEVGIKLKKTNGFITNDFLAVNSQHYDTQKECMQYVRRKQKIGELK